MRISRPLAGILFGSLVFASLGCDRGLGECNLDGTTEDNRPIPGPAALDLVFRAIDGLPMYEGQALMQSSCGDGEFCHSPAAVGGDRIGTPAGLDFDVALACAGPTVDPSCVGLQPCAGAGASSPYCVRLQRLSSNRDQVQSWASDIDREIRSGSMPPGAAGARVRDDTPWFRTDGTQLPTIGSSDANEIVRNWLACAAPVVARTELAPSEDLELTPCESVESETCIYSGPITGLPDPAWSSIYFGLLIDECVRCHAPVNGNADRNPIREGQTIPGGASPAGLAALDLSGTDPTDTRDWPSESHAAVVDVSASSAGLCEGEGVLVVSNDAASSLMIQKMRAVQTCGQEMPIAEGTQTIPDAVIDVVEEWIDLGAPND